MLTIGEFSRLSEVSARMLRHYDKIGLLRPAHIGRDNGYRYYDMMQLSVIQQIEMLKRYGFTLTKIKRLLPLSEAELAEEIHCQRLKAYAELNEMRKTLRLMEEEIMNMEGVGSMQDKYHVITMVIPEQKVFSIRRTIDIGQVNDLFDELLAEIEKRGIKRAGATQMLYHNEEFSYQDMDVDAQVQVAGAHPDIVTVPEQLCAAVTHVGPYENLKYAYHAIQEWMQAHKEYYTCAAPIERYLKDEKMVSPEEMETGILFPIALVK